MTRKVAIENNVYLIDLDQAIPKSAELMFDSVHFTDKGCQAVAQVITNELIQNDMLGFNESRGT